MSLIEIWSSNATYSRRWKKWTKKETETLSKLWIDNVKVEDIAEKLDRSYSSIRSRLLELDLPQRRITRVWSLEDESKLKNLYKSKTNHELACIFGLTEDQVKHKINHMKLARREVNVWSNDDVNFLIENKHCKSNNELAEDLGRSVGSVRAKLYNMRKKGEI